MFHVVDRGQLQVQNKNIRGLKDASPPRCKKDLRGFLGMTSVYRRFVKDYAQVARPLAAMTSSSGPTDGGRCRKRRWGLLRNS